MQNNVKKISPGLFFAFLPLLSCEGMQQFRIRIIRVMVPAIETQPMQKPVCSSVIHMRYGIDMLFIQSCENEANQVAYGLNRKPIAMNLRRQWCRVSA